MLVCSAAFGAKEELGGVYAKHNSLNSLTHAHERSILSHDAQGRTQPLVPRPTHPRTARFVKLLGDVATSRRAGVRECSDGLRPEAINTRCGCQLICGPSSA